MHTAALSTVRNNRNCFKLTVPVGLIYAVFITRYQRHTINLRSVRSEELSCGKIKSNNPADKNLMVTITLNANWERQLAAGVILRTVSFLEYY